MKIIDFEKKGNMVKFSLGDESLETWLGDDWDDAPYEHNAGYVYKEYISGYRVVVFDFDDIVFEPCDGVYNSHYSKEDMRERRVPCICVLRKEHIREHEYFFGFQDIVGNDKVERFYFGDLMEPENSTVIKRLPGA